PLPNRGFDDPAEKVGVGAAGILGRELDVVGVAARLPDGGAGALENLVPGGLQLVLDVQVGGRDEDVQPGPCGGADGFAGQLDVALVAARQRGDDRPTNLGGD